MGGVFLWSKFSWGKIISVILKNFTNSLQHGAFYDKIFTKDERRFYAQINVFDGCFGTVRV